MLKPVYDHRTGTLGPPRYLRPARYLVVEGLLGFYTETLRAAHDVRVFLAPPEELRRAWKVKRDCTRRGYTTDQVLWELDHRERDAELHPPAAGAMPTSSSASGRTPAATPRTSTPRSSCATRCRTRTSRRCVDDVDDGPSIERHERELLLRIPGDIDPDHAAAIEEAVWERMSFASHLRVRQLGEFTVGTDLLRSDSLALVQVILLYHMVSRARGAGRRRQPRAQPRAARRSAPTARCTPERRPPEVAARTPIARIRIRRFYML